MRLGLALLTVCVIGAGCTPSDGGAESTIPATTTTVVTTTSTVAPSSTTSMPTTTSLAVPELDLTYGLRINWVPRVGVRWQGLPDEAVQVTLVWPQTTNPRTEPVVDCTAAFEFTKPDWSRYATFTAHDESGDALVVEERLVDGGTCSAGGENPEPQANLDLPVAVEDARVYLFGRAVRCAYVAFERAAVESGEFFGVGRDDLAAELKELDRRQAIMEQIRTVLLVEATEERRDGLTVYVFANQGIEVVLDDSGQLISASA